MSQSKDPIEYFDYLQEQGITPQPCQCCGFPTEGFGYICDNCGWEQDLADLPDNAPSDSNGGVSLAEYRAAHHLPVPPVSTVQQTKDVPR